MPTHRFTTEPAFRHGAPSGTAVLYCNLGTPDEPTPAAVRRYLAQFLSDPRVVELPRLPWLAVLHGIILRVRPARSAAKYASIWTPQGSPLRVWTEKQALLLQGWLAQRGHSVIVRHAMRYGQPSIPDVLDALKAQGIVRILVLPAYPQYSATTTASVFDAVHAWAGRTRVLPELRFVNRFHDDEAYVDALTRHVRAHWQMHGRGDRLVMSFHGLPRQSLERGDPYHCECQKTARLLAHQLGLGAEGYLVTFQSRIGRGKWLQPYTEPALVALARSGVRRVDVVFPGFTGDCLETLEEIAIAARAAFLAAGGRELQVIPCLNDRAQWIGALCELALRHLQGWPTAAQEDSEARAATRSRALQMGASQ